MYVHIIILISTVLLASFSMSQYASSHDLTQSPIPTVSKFGAFASFAVIIFFAMKRTDYIDTSSYVGAYLSSSETGIGSAVNAFFNAEHGGFIATETIIRTFFGNNSEMYLLVMALIGYWGFISLFRKYSVDYRLTLYFFITTQDYTSAFNAMRQVIAVSIMLSASDAFIKRKLLKFLLLLGLSFTFHPSAIVWLPVYFFAHEKPWSKKMVIFFLGIAFAIFFTDTFTNFLSDVGDSLGYKNVTYGGNMGIMRALFFAAMPVFLFLKRNELEDAPEFIKISINLSAVTASMCILATLTSGITIGRMMTYFNAYNCIALPYALKDRNGQDNSMYRIIFILAYLYFFYISLQGNAGMYVSSSLGIYEYNL